MISANTPRLCSAPLLCPSQWSFIFFWQYFFFHHYQCNFIDGCVAGYLIIPF